MDIKEILLLIALGIFSAFSIYKKYFRKDSAGKSGSKDNIDGKSTIVDDYEPYQDKQD